MNDVWVVQRFKDDVSWIDGVFDDVVEARQFAKSQIEGDYEEDNLHLPIEPSPKKYTHNEGETLVLRYEIQ